MQIGECQVQETDGMIIYLIIHLVQIVHQGFQVLFLAHASKSWKIAGVGTTTSITDASAIWILHSGTLKWEGGNGPIRNVYYVF